MATVDFITFLTKNSLGYAQFLRATGEILSSNNHSIKWKCVLSNGAKVVPYGYDCINVVSFNKSNSSLRHGLTINSILDKIESEYVIISDADVAMTYKNWDEEIIKILDNGYDCFGAENVIKEREHLHFPNVPFFCFKKEVMKKTKMDFTPIMENNDIKRLIISDPEEAKFYEKSIGERVIFNTGSRLYRSFKEEGLNGKNLQSVLIHSDKVQLKFKNEEEKEKVLKRNIPMRNLIEFHLDGKVFLTHHGRSRVKSFKSSKIRNWSDRVREYINLQYGFEIVDA